MVPLEIHHTFPEIQMLESLCWVVVASAGLLDGALAEPVAKCEMAALQGTWVLTSVELRGEKCVPEKASDWKRIICGTTLIETFPSPHTFSSELWVEGTGNPKILHLTTHFWRRPCYRSLLYQVDGETLTVADRESSHELPSQLQSSPGSDVCVFHFTKEQSGGTKQPER